MFVSGTSPLEVLVDRASKRLYEMLVIGEHVTLKVTSHGSVYEDVCCVIPVFSRVCLLHTVDWTTVFILPAKAREYVFTGIDLSVCLSVVDHNN